MIQGEGNHGHHINPKNHSSRHSSITINTALAAQAMDYGLWTINQILGENE